MDLLLTVGSPCNKYLRPVFPDNSVLDFASDRLGLVRMVVVLGLVPFVFVLVLVVLDVRDIG